MALTRTATGPNPIEVNRVSGNPYRMQTPSRRSTGALNSNKLLWILVAGVLIAVPLLCCGGMFLVGYLGLGVLAADIEIQLRDHPTIRQHIGEIEDLSVNFLKSSAIDDPDTFIYDIRGDKGAGELTITSISEWEGNEDIVAAELRLESGAVIEIELQAEKEN